MANNGLLASRLNKTNPPSNNSNIKPIRSNPISDGPLGIQQNIRSENPLCTRRDAAEENDFSYEDFENELERDSLKKAYKREAVGKTIKHISLISKVLVVALTLYACFAIFGLITTDYVYNDEGEIEPEILSVADLKILEEYNSLSAFYLRARIIYEDTLKLDYRLSQNPNDALMIAMEYTEMLEKVDKLIVDLSAAEYDTKYTAIYSQINTWATTDIALYLQYMAKAITNDDAEAANNAVVARDVVYQDFAQLTSNIAKIADGTKGAKNIDIYSWTPDSFVSQLSSGEEK